MMGLLTALLSQELPENRACRDAADAAGPDDPETVLDPLMERAIDFNSASLPLVAGSVADSDLLRRQQQVNREAGTGPRLAIDARDEVFRTWHRATLPGAASSLELHHEPRIRRRDSSTRHLAAQPSQG
jgi:hypothetical protein